MGPLIGSHVDAAGGLATRGLAHAGSASRWDRDSARDRALRQVGELLLPVLDKLGDDDPGLLIEPMASQEGDVAALRQLRDCRLPA